MRSFRNYCAAPRGVLTTNRFYDEVDPRFFRLVRQPGSLNLCPAQTSDGLGGTLMIRRVPRLRAANQQEEDQ